MPLEEVKLEEGEGIMLTSKRLQREDYWYRELNTYGLNDNIKKVGNISKNKDKGIVVWTLFNKHTRKSRRRPNKKLKKKIKKVNIEMHIKELLAGYKSPGFVNKLRMYEPPY